MISEKYTAQYFGKSTFLLFTLFSIALYLDLLLGFRHLAHDTLSYNYPIRAFLSDSFRQGIFPWWDSWNSPGFPITLLQAERFYPPFLILGTLFHYEPWVFYLELIITTIWCLTGTFLWLRRQNVSRLYAQCGAMAFAGSGPIVTSVFSYPIQVSMFHIPWIFLATDLLCRSPQNWRNISIGAALAALSAWLMLTGGYITVTYMAFLLVTLYAVVVLTTAPTRIPAFLAGSLVTLVILAGLVFLPAIQYILLVHPFMDTLTQRSLGVSFSPFQGSLPPLAPLSLFFANASYIPDMLTGRAEQMYIGSLLAISIPTTLFSKNTDHRQIVFLVLAVTVLLLSMNGSISPLAALAVRYVPLLDKMRLHVFWSVFAVFFLITVSCRGISAHITKLSRDQHKNFLKLYVIIAITVVATTTLIRFLLPFDNEWDIVLTPYDYIVFLISIFVTTFIFLCLRRICTTNNESVKKRAWVRSVSLSFIVLVMFLIIITTFSQTAPNIATKLQTSYQWDTMPSAMFCMDLLQLFMSTAAVVFAIKIKPYANRTAATVLILVIFFDMSVAAHRYHQGKPHLYGKLPITTTTRRVAQMDNNIRGRGEEGTLAFATRTPQIQGYIRLYDPRIALLSESPQGNRLLSRLLWFHPGSGAISMASWSKKAKEPRIDSMQLHLDSLSAVIKTDQAGTLFWTDMWAP